MTDENEISTKNTKTKSPKQSRRLVAMLAAGLLVVIGAGITGMSVGVAAKRQLIEELLNQERAARGMPPTIAWDK